MTKLVRLNDVLAILANDPNLPKLAVTRLDLIAAVRGLSDAAPTRYGSPLTIEKAMLPSRPDAAMGESGSAKLWECPDCAFGFDERHTNADGRNECPVCELAAMHRKTATLRAALVVAREDIIKWSARFPIHSTHTDLAADLKAIDGALE